MRGVGHFLMIEAPAEFNRELEDIIKQIKQGL
jgi:pimeloyl-ACP methyl ester carboxylesterase